MGLKHLYDIITLWSCPLLKIAIFISFLLILLTEEDYNQAITFYTQAIDLNPNVAAYYGNRSFAYLRTECFGYALLDATKALQIDKKYIKVTVIFLEYNEGSLNLTILT